MLKMVLFSLLSPWEITKIHIICFYIVKNYVLPPFGTWFVTFWSIRPFNNQIYRRSRSMDKHSHGDMVVLCEKPVLNWNLIKQFFIGFHHGKAHVHGSWFITWINIHMVTWWFFARNLYSTGIWLSNFLSDSIMVKPMCMAVGLSHG